MQNQFVFSAGKSLAGHLFSGSIVKGLGLSQQKSTLPRLANDLLTRNNSDNSVCSPLLLPGGGLGKLHGSFKEEQYFNIHENMVMAQLQQNGYRLKCESIANVNWKEFERMANDYTEITAVRQSGQLSKYRNCPEESFFLQEQRSLLERIIDALRRLFGNRGFGGPMYPPPPYGGGYYPYGQPYFQTRDEKKTEDKKKDEDDSNKAVTNEDEAEKPKEEKEENDGPQNTSAEEPQDEPQNEPNDESHNDPHDFNGSNDGRGDEQNGEGRE